MDRYDIAQLIETARFLYKRHRESADYDSNLFVQYLRIKRLVNKLMEQDRKHRQNISHVWYVYTKSVLESKGIPIESKKHMVAGKDISQMS